MYSLRTTRVNEGMNAMPSAHITLRVLEPRIETNTSASSTLGKANRPSMMRMTTSSSTPP